MGCQMVQILGPVLKNETRKQSCLLIVLTTGILLEKIKTTLGKLAKKRQSWDQAFAMDLPSGF